MIDENWIVCCNLDSLSGISVHTVIFIFIVLLNT